jgi:hypothetical protein
VSEPSRIVLAFAILLASACVPVPRGEGPSPAGRGSGAGGGLPEVDAGCEARESVFVTAFPADGPCDDTEPVQVSMPSEAKGRYAVTCEPQPLDQRGCKGVPNDSWGRCVLRHCEGKVSYPEGCTVYLPHENPYYPGSPQQCTCMPLPGVTDVSQWMCPI